MYGFQALPCAAPALPPPLSLLFYSCLLGHGELFQPVQHLPERLHAGSSLCSTMFLPISSSQPNSSLIIGGDSICHLFWEILQGF